MANATEEVDNKQKEEPQKKADSVQKFPYEGAKHTIDEQNAFIKSNHQGIGMHVTGWGLFANAAIHMVAYTPTLLCFLGTIMGGYWTWLTFFVGWVLVPIFDLLIGADSYNLTAEEEKAWKHSIWFRVVTWFHLPFQIAIITFCCWWVSQKELSWLEWLGITFSVGTAQGFGIGCVHEMIHRPETYDFMNGIMSLCFSSYGHFWIEHVWAHHRHVATDLDCASSDVGDAAWWFVPRCMFTTLTESWEIEQRIMRIKKHYPLSPFHNRIIIAWIFTGMIALTYKTLFGPDCLSFFFMQGLIASWIVDNTNYVEHYGLRRKEIAPGEYERVGWLHAWDTPDLLTNMMLFKIQRHPDHHTNAGRPYQILRTFKDAPTLPTGYAGCIVLSWFPPLWRMVMDPRVKLVKEQQRELELHGTVRGEKYIFPDGAQAVATHDDHIDREILGMDSFDVNGNKQSSIEQATSVAPKNDQGGLKRVDDEREHVALRWVLLIAIINGVCLGGYSAGSKTWPGRIPELFQEENFVDLADTVSGSTNLDTKLDTKLKLSHNLTPAGPSKLSHS